MPDPTAKPAPISVAEFLAAIPNPGLRSDIDELVRLFAEVTDEEPVVWGKALGFGRYAYRYASGHGGEWYVAGIGVRKDGPTLHLGCGVDSETELLSLLGKHKAGKGCVNLRRVSDIDKDVLRELLRRCVSRVRDQWGVPA